MKLNEKHFEFIHPRTQKKLFVASLTYILFIQSSVGIYISSCWIILWKFDLNEFSVNWLHRYRLTAREDNTIQQLRNTIILQMFCETYALFEFRIYIKLSQKFLRFLISETFDYFNTRWTSGLIRPAIHSWYACISTTLRQARPRFGDFSDILKFYIHDNLWIKKNLFFRYILQLTLEAQRVKITREHKNSYIYYFKRNYITINLEYTIYSYILKYYIHDNLWIKKKLFFWYLLQLTLEA